HALPVFAPSIRPHACPTLFPYTTLFRSQDRVDPVGRTVRRTPLEQLEGQVGLGGPGAEEQRLRLHARQPHRRVRRVVQGEHRLEQRVPGQGTGRRERVDQRLERQVLVRVGGQVRGADAVEQFLEGR